MSKKSCDIDWACVDRELQPCSKTPPGPPDQVTRVTLLPPSRPCITAQPLATFTTLMTTQGRRRNGQVSARVLGVQEVGKAADMIIPRLWSLAR